MLHCAMFSIIALMIFNVSSLHLSRKGLLKLIVVRIWFRELSPQLHGQLIAFRICFPKGCYPYAVECHSPLCQLSTVDTCAIALHCIMLIITYYIKS